MNEPRFAERYRQGLSAFVADRSERRLEVAYELGRAAVRSGMGILDVAAEHTQALLTVAAARPAAEAGAVIKAAGDFLIESLAAFEMVQRGVDEVRLDALRQRRRARMLRELSSLFADASVAAMAPESAREVAQLVAEITREATGAVSTRVQLRAGWAANPVEATVASADLGATQNGQTEAVQEPLSAFDGRSVGLLEIEARAGAIGKDDRELVRQIAQMTSAWLERAERQHS